MPKRPLLAVALLTLILGISTQVQAAGNPDLTALVQGSVVQFTWSERIAQPFAFDIELTDAHPALNFANVVGQPVQVTKGEHLDFMAWRGLQFPDLLQNGDGE